jgi:hypothetical protein
LCEGTYHSDTIRSTYGRGYGGSCLATITKLPALRRHSLPRYQTARCFLGQTYVSLGHELDRGPCEMLRSGNHERARVLWVRTPRRTKALLSFRKQPRVQMSCLRAKAVDFRALPSRLLRSRTDRANDPALADPIFPKHLRLKDNACRPNKNC